MRNRYVDFGAIDSEVLDIIDLKINMSYKSCDLYYISRDLDTQCHHVFCVYNGHKSRNE